MKLHELRDFWREFWHVMGHPFKPHTPTVVEWDDVTLTGTLKCGPCDKIIGTFKI